MASDNFNGFFAFLGGAVVGCLAALLLAPEKGEKTRSRLKTRLQSLNQAVYLEEEDVANLIEEEAEESAMTEGGGTKDSTPA